MTHNGDMCQSLNVAPSYMQLSPRQYMCNFHDFHTSPSNKKKNLTCKSASYFISALVVSVFFSVCCVVTWYIIHQICCKLIKLKVWFQKFAYEKKFARERSMMGETKKKCRLLDLTLSISTLSIGNTLSVLIRRLLRAYRE